MNNYKIEEKLMHLPEFIGVFPSDTHCLPRINNFPCGLVSNLDNHFFPGSHWVAMYFNSKNDVDYFDSYGNPPIIPSHLEFMWKYSKNVFYNSKKVQGPFSTTCGGHCINFISLKSQGYSLEKIANSYSDNKELNDSVIYKKFH